VSDKFFKSLDEQLRLQEERGLKINDPLGFKKYLLENNYFNIINGFETLFLKSSQPKQYYEEISTEDFRSIFELDRKISLFLFEDFSKIEMKFSTSIAYRLTESYNERSRMTQGSDNDFFMNKENYPNHNGSEDLRAEYFDRHKFFRTSFPRRNVAVNNINFTGQVFRVNGELCFEGTFTGSFKGLNRNSFQGKFYVSGLDNSDSILEGNYEDFCIPEDTTGKMNCSNYSDFCKIEYPYISKYEHPPLWVIINTLTLNELNILYWGLELDVKNKIIEDVGYRWVSPFSKTDEFMSYLEVMRECRNVIAHFGLITRLRTRRNLTINRSLVDSLSLQTFNGGNRIVCFWDILKILCQVDSVDGKRIKKLISNYLLKNMTENKNTINKNFLDRIYKRRR
jgi:putative uncharacterized protein gbs1223